MTAFREEHPLIAVFGTANPEEVFLVGDKAAMLMRAAACAGASFKIPESFIITTELSDIMLQNKEMRAYIKQKLKELDIAKAKSVKNVSRDIRKKIMNYALPAHVEQTLLAAFGGLEKKSRARAFSLAIRPSVYGYTKGILSESAHHYSLSVHSGTQFLRAVRLGIASLFSESALLYREAQGIDHRAVKMALLVQEMVGTGKTTSGTVMTDAQKNTMVMQASYGLPVYAKNTSIIPDSYTLFKPALSDQKSAIIKKNLGSKRSKIKEESRQLKETPVTVRDRHRFCLDEEQITQIARCSFGLETYFNAPLFIEWAYDEKNTLCILDVRILKTPHNSIRVPETYELKQKSDVLLTGMSVGTKVVSGTVFTVRSKKSNSLLIGHAILVTKSLEDVRNFITTKAKAIIVEDSIQNNHTLQLARELDIPVIFGATGAVLINYS